MEVVENKKKRRKPENFIGWKSPDGKLEVIGIIEKSKHTTFKVTCTECSKDKELFPDGYFVSTKGNLVKGKKPCGCGRHPRWEGWQFLILAHRAAKGRFIVHGFAEEFHGKNTKLNLECTKDSHKWTASISSVINGGYGCLKCGLQSSTEQRKTSYYVALQKCIDICKENNYNVVGFVNGYRGAFKTCFEYICKIHGEQSVSYSNFVNHGSRCSSCTITGYSTNKQGTFYVYQWTKDDHSFIKFGITNQKELARIKKQKRETYYKYKKIWAATFKDGSIPLYIENYIKGSMIDCGVVSKDQFPDGFTETTHMWCLDALEILVIDAICKI